MKKLLYVVTLLMMLNALAFAGEDAQNSVKVDKSAMMAPKDGLITLKSAHSVKDTADKLVAMLKEKGMTVFTRIDHSAGAKKVDQMLLPTELVIFGNPKVGTPLMKCNITAGIDLPQKALIYENESGDVFFTYNDPKYMAKRHNLTGCDKVVTKVGNVLGNFAKAATSK